MKVCICMYASVYVCMFLCVCVCGVRACVRDLCV